MKNEKKRLNNKHVRAQCANIHHTILFLLLLTSKIYQEILGLASFKPKEFIKATWYVLLILID